MNWVVGGAVIVLAAIMMWNMPNAQTGPEPRTQTLFTFPVRAADYISTLPASTRMYNDFSMGGYLIYRLYPQHKVFIDGRGDMFRVGVFEDSITIEGANPGWSKALDAYQINTAVTTSGGPLDRALSQDNGWSVGYRDNVAVVYRRSNSPTH